MAHLRGKAPDHCFDEQNQAFNEVFKFYFTFVDIFQAHYMIIHFVDIGIAYSESQVVRNRRHSVVPRAFQAAIIHKHSAPDSTSTDKKLDAPNLAGIRCND